MATKPKAILSTHDGREASPITKASNVLFENGQTAQDVLNDRQDAMISPVIENSSSMFKVGQGDNVDYSANVVNGAYESMVLKGKSMVNCIQESSSQDVVLPYEFEEGRYVTINDTKESGALGVELKGQTLVNLAIEKGIVFNEANQWKHLGINQSLLNSSKKYLVSFNSSHDFKGYIHLRDTATNQYITEAKHASFKQGNNKVLIDGFSQTDLNAFVSIKITFWLDSASAVFPTISNVILLEYQEGMENWDIPYFEGMKSVQMPTLKSTGKNLFNINGNVNEEYDGLIASIDPNIIDGNVIIPSSKSDWHHGKGQKIKIKKGGMYTCSFTTSDGGIVDVYSSNLKYCASNKTSTFTFTAPADCDEVLITFATRGSASGGKIYNFQIEEGSAATSYEPYKANILTVNEEVELRGIGDVKDTLDCLTGELTQRIGEYTIDGNENWEIYGNFNVDGYKSFITTITGLSNLYINSISFISGDFKTGSWNDYVGKKAEEIVWNHDPNKIGIKVKNETASNVEELKTFLASNPITVQYELATPIIKTVDFSIVDQNGNTIPTLKSWNTITHIYSEIPENTLYPILSHSNPTYPVILKPSTKYSIVANSYSNNHTNSTINFNLGGATASTTVGNRVTTITTPSTLTNEELVMSGRGNKLNNVMVIEGDVAGDLPYFEGICDCKSPILSNVEKNLWNSSLNETCATMQNSDFNRGSYSTTKEPILKVLPNREYEITFKTQQGTGLTHTVLFGLKLDNQPMEGNNSPNASVSLSTTKPTHATRTIVTDTTGYLYFYALDYSRDGGFVERLNKALLMTEIWVQEVGHADLEPYKSNTTTFDQKDGKTIVLRSLPNGVRDTLNVETGEYVQRIGEVVLDGTKRFGKNMPESEYNKPCVRVSCTNALVNGSSTPNFNIKADKIAIGHYSYNMNYPVMAGLHEQTLYIYIPRTIIGLTTNDNDGESIANAFNSWLTRNPITVQYPLATPIVSTVDVQGFPYAYTSGHVQLSSGSIEQSLTPKVEYSVATNRNGQIRSNQKMVERHQKQLDQLQAIILANLVNSQYNQTLTTLKYELSRV